MAEYAEINIFDYFRVIKKRRWLITAVTVMALLIASIITSRIPEQFVSTVTLILPEGRRTSSGAGLAYLSQILSMTSFNSSEFERPYQELLQSQLMAKKVAKILGRSSTNGISVFKTGGKNVFNISCKNSDRKMAALMANAYARALFEYEQETSRKSVDDKLKYINLQLSNQEQNLRNAEQNVIDFQRANKVLSVEGEVSVAIQSIARMKLLIIDLEAEMNNAKKYYSENHPDLVALRNDIQTRKDKLQEEIEKGISQDVDKTKGGGVLSNMLEKSVQYYRLQKVVEVQRAISRLLLEESEKLKLEKGKEIQPFQVIDPAVPSRFPTIPNVKFNIFLGLILGLVAGLSLSFFLEYLEALSKRENYPLK